MSRATTELFDFADRNARERLMASHLGGLLAGEVLVDLFCGAGGWGEGAKVLGLEVAAAVNHWPEAIATHARNNPGCVHHMGDAWKARPGEVLAALGKKGRRKVGVLLASAACTTHSRARGAAPISKRVHMLGWCIARWAEELKPRIVLVENVPEWVDWGPLVPKRDERGRPVQDDAGRALMVQDPARKGRHFRRWWRYMERLGYRVEMRVLSAPDVGEASRRKRLFVQARRDGMPIVWPEPTHGEGLAPLRTAAECIDWSDLGTSIFDRPRALKPKTQARIAEGIRRYVIADPAPFVLRVTQANGKGWAVAPVDAPMPTQTTRQDLAVCTPVLGRESFGVAMPIMATARNGEREGQSPRCHPVTGPLMTVTGGAAEALATPVMAYHKQGNSQATRVDEPVRTVLANGLHAGLVAPVLAEYYGSSDSARPVDEPLGAVTTRGRAGRGPCGHARPASWPGRRGACPRGRGRRVRSRPCRGRSSNRGRPSWW